MKEKLTEKLTVEKLKECARLQEKCGKCEEMKIILSFLLEKYYDDLDKMTKLEKRIEQLENHYHVGECVVWKDKPKPWGVGVIKEDN